MKLQYTLEQLEAEHDYATPHVECGQKLHGGFDADGAYLSPRTRYRWEAVRHWQANLTARGVPLVEATTALLTEPNFPNVEQQLFLLSHGIEQGFWNSLTITGLIEARGKALAEVTAPDYQAVIVEDISDTALAHMNKGLLTSHGWDEGGNPATDIGGHDTMWFTVRDLVFGAGKYPIPEAPASIGRDKEEREMPLLPPEHEMMLSFLMNLLMIEVRAERAFDFYEKVLRSEQVFTNHRKEAEHAALLVDRIRQDESVHVAWLKAAISEFRSFTVKTLTGDTVNGASIVDPVWEKMVQWHAVEMHKVNRPQNEAALKESILEAPDGQQVYQAFLSLAAA